MKPLNKYLNGLFGNLGMSEDALAKDDIERLRAIYSGPVPEYIADEASLIVKYPFDHPYILFNIYSKPLDEANVNTIKFVNNKDELLNRYSFRINRNINYPGRLFDKMVFPKDAEINFICENDFRLDDGVFKGNKFKDKLKQVSISDEEPNEATLDLSKLTTPMTCLAIFDFLNIKFNPKQKINKLKLKMLDTMQHINTLPDCDELIIDTQYLDKKSANMIVTMFDDYTPNKHIPKISFVGNLTPLTTLKIKNIINASNK